MNNIQLKSELQYMEALQEILVNGEDVPASNERTGTGTKKLHSWFFQHYMDEGFPAMTTKKLQWKPLVGELIAFLEGSDDAARFRELGCNIWNANANQHPAVSTGRSNTWLNNPNRRGEDHLGRIYGVQARRWQRPDGGYVDQLANMLDGLMNDPMSRRLFVTHANPGEQDQMALPPCHTFYQVGVMPETKTIDLMWYQRSCDMFLGVPFNIASYALKLEILAAVTGYKAGTLSGCMFDVHIYKNHIDQVQEQLSRKPYEFPELEITGLDTNSDLLAMLDNKEVHPDMFKLRGYNHHEAIPGLMAI